jgi:hypothetical protein
MFRKGKNTSKENLGDEDVDGKESEQTLKPNRIFYIELHSSFTKTIKILDLTDLVKSEYPSEQFENETKQIATSSPPQPWLNITRTATFLSKKFVAEKPGEQNVEVAQWKGGRFSSSSNTFTFPPDSPHSSHPITVEAESKFKFREQFVKDSVVYLWKPDNALTARKFTLYRIIGAQKQVVGRYWQGRWQVRCGGTLVLDTHEVDEVVAVLSMVSTLRKKRQKAAEHSGGGGGGG